jgi:peptidoglycan/xylan/chitin deacetylase (PgdA/CDA1 family)
MELDGMSFWSDGLGMSSLSDCSRGEFERVAVPRVLAVLAEYDVTCTWFVPGVTALTFPDLVEAVVAAGHEVAHHGHRHKWEHESAEAEREDFEQATEVLTSIAGARPRGYRAPGGGLTDNGVQLLVEHDFLWESSLSGDDFNPYYVRQGAGMRADATYEWGTETSVLEVPCNWNMDDCPSFEFIWGTNAGLRPPSHVLESWLGELDYMEEHATDGLYQPVFHSQVIGRAHRLPLLRGVCERIAGSSTAEFVTFSTYAERWQAVHAG